MRTQPRSGAAPVKRARPSGRVRNLSIPRTVRQAMTRRPVTLKPTDGIGLAHQQMVWLGIRHLPVVDGARVVGIISDRDVLGAVALHGASEARRHPAKDIMRSPVQTVSPAESLEDAAARMATSKIGCLPVIEGGKLVGILTTTDVLADRAAGALAREPGKPLPGAKELMTVDPVTVAPETSLLEAASRMASEGVRHLPVTDDAGRLIGMLSDRDLRAAIGDPLEALRTDRDESETRVADVMTPDPVRFELDASMAEVADLLADERVGAIAVVDERDRPVGIVSYVDLMGWLARAAREGKGKRGIR